MKLHKAKLKDADLELANLQGAELDGAELEGANFKDVKNLTWDQLKKANFEKGKPIHLGKNEKDEDLNKFWEEEVTARKSSNQALPPMAS